MNTVERSGFAKRLINAADYLFTQNDPESALTPLCNAIDRAARDQYGAAGRGAYKRWVHEHMETITRVAYNGLAILNDNYAMPPMHDEHGKLIPYAVRDAADVGLYSFEQILYHLVRCKLVHECDLAPRVRDSGRRDGEHLFGLDRDGNLSLPLYDIALGLLFALLVEAKVGEELRGTVFESVAWNDIPVIDLVGRPERISGYFANRGTMERSSDGR